MATSTSLKSCFNWKVTAGILCVVTVSTQLAEGPTWLAGITRIIILPGVIADMLLSGNIHSGFANPALDYSVGIGSAWLFWTILAVVAKWLFRRGTSKCN